MLTVLLCMHWSGMCAQDFDPENPGNPGEPSFTTYYTLTTNVTPSTAGSSSPTSTSLAEGGTATVSASANSNYTFVHWMCGDTVVSTSQKFTYTMPAWDVALTAEFTFDPSAPANPDANYYDSSLGEVIMDDFDAGSLLSSLYEVIGGSSSSYRSQVTQVTVSGAMNSSDFSFVDYFSNCTYIDLSRAYGFTSVPAYAFDGTALVSVVLPSVVESIGNYAFKNCEDLASVSLYAVTPPTLGTGVFDGIPEGLIVYVPAAAVSIYADDDDWGQYTILPLEEDVYELTVNLPADASDGRYKDMTLELTNTASGQRYKYVITSRTIYTFYSLMSQTAYNVSVKTANGSVLGTLTDVAIAEEDVEVSFESLLQPRDVSLTILTPDGEDVTAQATITWSDASGTYIKQGSSLTGQVEQTILSYAVTLPQALALSYVAPEAGTHTVAESDNDLQITLEPFAEATLTGKVCDASTGSAISGATVTLSQTLNGTYTKTFTATTGSKGAFTLTALALEGILAASATDYVAQTLDTLTLDTLCDVGTLSLSPITGARITTNYTYTESVSEGDEADTQNWYSDYANVAYTVYNVTQGRELTQFSVQFPEVVLLEDVTEGDVLRLTASSKKSAFTDVAVECTISDNAATVTVPIVELGAISATFASTDNAEVVGILYDASGQYLQCATYNNARLTLSDLADGDYTLVTMGSSSLFNSIMLLSQYASAGLVEGTHYVRDDVNVRSGLISAVSNTVVPELDEDSFTFTSEDTYFTVNKTSITSGNYLTLKGKIDFLDEYADRVEDVCLVVDLPEECSFVESSVMVGTGLAGYTIDGSRITIPIASLDDYARFCIIPTLGGDYAPCAYATFQLDGEPVTQPIGNAAFTVSDLSITVPSIVAKTSVTISGTAPGKASVTIYDGEAVIGNTTALANGNWSATCELNQPYNLSTHDICAKVVTSQGLQLQTGTFSCFYDRDAVEVSKVTMFYSRYEVVFDFQNPSAASQSYTYASSNDFTFTIEFTDNDTTKVSNVVLYVETNRGNIQPLKASFDANLGYWVANGQFANTSSGGIPVNVSVDFVFYSACVLDTLELRDAQYFWADILEEMSYLEINSLITECEEMCSSESPDCDAISDSIQAIIDLLDVEEVELNDTDLALVDSLLAAETEEEMLGVWNRLVVETYPDPPEEDTYDGGEDTWEVTTDDGDFIVHYIPGSAHDDTDSKSGYDAYAAEGEWVTDTSPYETTGYIDDEAATKVTLTNSVTGDVIEVDFNGLIQSSQANNDESYNYICEVSAGIVTDLQSYSNTVISEQIASYQETIDQLSHRMAIMEEVYRVIGDVTVNSGIGLMDLGAQTLAERLNDVSLLTEQSTMYRMLSHAGSIFSLVTTAANIWNNRISSTQSQIEWWDLIGDIYTHCQLDEAERLEEIAMNRMRLHRNKNWGINLLHTVSAGLTVVGVVAAPETAGASMALTLAGMIVDVGSNALDRRFETDNTRYYNELVEEINSSSKCTPLDEDDGPGEYKSGNPNATPITDPSGYVYEGVSSNRLEGVTATCYYKETLEDMYGDLYEVVDVWDAEAYAQENPLFTDEQGMYRWDVPEGLWQVKFEKDGYVTTYSEWLPVPPPQLDVNIAMTQNLQPDVLSAVAYEEGIEVTFNKYMQPTTLTTDYIYALVDNEKMEGSVTLLDEEVSYEGESDTYASRVRFVPDEPFAAGSEVTLVVSRRVKSYAGIQMQSDFTQVFDVELEVTSIEVDSVLTVAYGGQHTALVQAIPADAAAGRSLVVSISSEKIATVDTDTVTLDEYGQALIVLSGVLPGATTATFSVDGTSMTRTATVQVTSASEFTAEPVASRASGTAVHSGATVSLTCDTEGAVIYYTTDGSCPCDETGTRQVYTEPIAITEAMTIRAMAVAEGMYESDVVAWSYTVIEPTDVEVTIYNPGWGTLYYGDRHLQVPDGLGAYVVTTADSLTATLTLISDGVIPARTAVVLKTDEDAYGGSTDPEDFLVYTLTLVDDADNAEFVTSNLLVGTDETVTLSVDTALSYYALSLSDPDDVGTISFYAQPDSLLTFTNPAHEAFLPLPVGSHVASLVLFIDEESTTGIHSIGNVTGAKGIYTLTGIRLTNSIESLPPGLYIVDGRRVFIANKRIR